MNKYYLDISKASDLKKPNERRLYRFFEIIPGAISLGTLLGVFIFSPTPYVILGDNKWENKNWCLMKTDLGEMPTLTKKEMDRCKQDILINYEDRGFNVIHQIYGYHTTDYINGGAISTKLCYMCCGISKEYSKKIMSAKSKSILYHCPWCSKDIKQKDGKLVQHHNLPEKRCIGSGQPITNKRIKQA